MRFFNNHDKYTAAYNGVSCNRYGLYLKERPNIPTGEERINEYEILGRDGKMYLETGQREDREFPIEIGFFGDPDTWTDKYRAIKKWLKTRKPETLPFNTLQFSDDTQYYYYVKKITLDTTEREAKDMGKATVTLTIGGYDYKRQGFIETRLTQRTVYNQQQNYWQPVFRIARAYDEVVDGVASIEIMTYKVSPDGFLSEDATLRVSLLKGETIYIDFSAPYAYIRAGANDPEIAFNRLSGDFAAIQRDTPLSWKMLTVGAEFEVYCKPLYKE